jgi:nicotinamidase-related amidase
MCAAKTLLELAGADLTPPTTAEATLVLIDFQEEYRQGPIAVSGFEGAVSSARRLLDAARQAGAPVIHIAHKGRAGGMFDRGGQRGQIIGELAPAAGEQVIEKGLPNAFAGTELRAVLEQLARSNLILAGFMTHMCVSSTARAGLDYGYRVSIQEAACATRDLPDGKGGTLAAATIHDVALAELADRFAIIIRKWREAPALSI